jgi:hypothetical protein
MVVRLNEKDRYYHVDGKMIFFMFVFIRALVQRVPTRN